MDFYVKQKFWFIYFTDISWIQPKYRKFKFSLSVLLVNFMRIIFKINLKANR